MSSISIFDQNYLQYDRWFDENADAFQAEIRALEALLPANGLVLEVGAGTGRFSVALGATSAVEPSRNMALLAKSRGVRVCQGLGEALPFLNGAFDCVLLITVLSFVDDERSLLAECRRVIKSKGYLLLAMLDWQSQLGAIYESQKEKDVFYRVASFHSIEHTRSLVKESGFKIVDFKQTMIGMPYETPGWDELKSGFGEGAFVGLLARKLDA